VTDLVETNQLAGGDTQIYQFTIPAGTLGIEARLEDRVQNPVMVLRGGNRSGPAGASGGSIPLEPYGNENGDPSGIDVHPTLINVGNITNNIYTLVVMARSVLGGFTNSSYTLRLNASGTTTVDFDGGTNSVADQAVRTWRYFRVTVPPTADGWDFRLLNVSSGQPRIVVRRESLPSALSTGPWSAPGGQTSWPINAQWAPTTDWTKRSFSSTNATLNEDGRIFACGMGRPLEPGTYFVGVYNNHATAAATYSVLSRGIGAQLSIPLIEIPFVGSYSATLPAREAAYFRVVVPSNSPSWKVKMTGDSGEAMMIGLRGNVPNIDMNTATGTLPNGKGMQKAGNEHYVLLPVSGQTNLPSSTNYFAVISEGVNPAAATRIGSGSSSITFESEGAVPVNSLGVVTSEDLVQPDLLQAGEVKAYQFLVPSGTLGLKVRLENREGNPMFVLRYGDKIPDPGAAIPATDTYGNEGGYASTEGNALLYTVPNPLPGLYTVSVKARPVSTTVFPDASYALRVQEILVPEINFGADQNTNGLSNVVSGTLDDNERVFYKFIIPETYNGGPVVGWRLELVQSSGLASMRVRKDLLPSDAAAASQMNFTTASTVIVPPFLTNGVWYVEVKGTGSTAFRLTSNPLTLERPVWTMPLPGQPSQTPGVLAPLFGDSGIDTNGFPLPGDSSTFLEQGTLHYYAVSVPTNNYGVLRAVLEAVSGNPDLYLRHGAPPTLYHNAAGANGTIYDRSMLANATEYANWVPVDGKLETTLKPGLWYMAVRAAGNANTRYRLKLSSGNVTEIPVHGPALSNQLLAGGDWRYYKLTAPATTPGGFNLTFSEQSGDVVVYLRDTIPPGNGNTGAAAEYKDWATDNKNQSAYLNFNTPGTYSFAAPPLRPGATYYLGVRAVNDAAFTIATTTNGVANSSLPTISFYGGTAVTNLASGQQTMYRIDVPAEATRWKHTATHAAGVQFFIEQGSFPTKGGTDDFRNNSAVANHTHNQYLLGAWPWVPAQSYFLVISNTTAVAQDIVFAMDGKNPETDDNDNDALPDSWELEYFGNTSSQLAAGDPDRDGVTNYDEFLEGTDPNDADSFRARLITSAIFGSIVRSPNAPSYELNQQVTLVATPDAGYAFIGWSGNASGLNNPLVLTMDDHKNIIARFKLAGDDFITALPLSGSSATIISANVGMSKETGEPNHAGNPGGKSIWWRWTAPSSGEVTLTTAGTPFNTLLAVYTGNAVTNLTRIASDNASGGTTNRSIVKFAAVSGQTYNIAVDGYNAASGRINLSLSMGGSTVGGAPRLVPISRLANGNAQIQLIGDANYTYPIETSTNLVNWLPLGTVTTDQTGVGVFTHTQSPNNYGFYRTRE
jgi:large repetitive protein